MHKALLFATSLVGVAIAQTLQAPYAAPIFASHSGGNWPNDSDWAALNNSVDGRLQALRPWAAVCYTSDPLFKEEECQTVIAGYKNDIQREAAPAALLWGNWESCGYDQGCALNYGDPQPVSNATCHQGSTPPYSISIRSAQDASVIVQWATAHNVKLTIRNTGHDYLGRSAAPSTLQVNTHQMDSLNYVPEFVPQGSDAAPVPALTMGAGAQIYNVYKYAAAHNFTPIIGACLTVGAAGGYLQGGGNSFLSPVYGLAVDNALEFEVVTADGQVRVANDAQNPDLFWALRGGGAGSWGIVTSATVRVHPPVTIGTSLLTIVPSPSKNLTVLGIDFISLAAKYQNSWVNRGIAHFFFVYQVKYEFRFYWPNGFADVSDLYPFFEELKGLSSDYTIISNTTSSSKFPSISAAIEQDVGPFFESHSHFGASNQFASRLVPQSYLDPSNPSSIRAVSEATWKGLEILNEAFGNKGGALLGDYSVVMEGYMPAATSPFVNETGANPGMYAAGWQTTYTAQWSLDVGPTANSKIMTALHNAVSPLTELGIKSSYLNEGDPFEKDWQEVFFGYKYERLLSIKQRYDPNNFFTTHKGVGFVTDLDHPAYQCYANKEKELL